MRISTCWFLIIAFLAAGFTSTMGDVICVGEDGHVEIEYANSPCCDQPVTSLMTSSESPLLQESGHMDGCIGCSDIPLTALSHINRPIIAKLQVLFESQFKFSPNPINGGTIIENPSGSPERYIYYSIEQSPPGSLFLIVSPILIC